ISFLVALNDGKIKMGQTVNGCGGQRMMYGRVMKDWNWHKGGYGMLTVSQCLEQSSNIGVSTLIDNNYHGAPEKFVQGLYKVGIAEDLKLDIPGYAVPRIRMPKKDKSNWSNTALPWMSIGYETQVPPISILTFYNGVANNGRMMRPRFVTCAMRNNELVREFPPQVIREQMASPQAIKDLQTCLFNVVDVGLGKRAGSKNFSVSGKTGTAQVWTKGGKTSGHLVSFTGYFPSEKPRYSCMVCIISNTPGASGGLHCAPVFRKVAEMVMANTLKPTLKNDTLHRKLPVVDKGNLHYASRVLNGFGVKTLGDFSDSEVPAWGSAITSDSYVTLQSQKVRSDIVPNVIGMGARDAVFYLEKLGLKVKVEGVGTVQQQSLPFGHVFKKGEMIRLKLGVKGYRPDDFVKDEAMVAQGQDLESDTANVNKKDTLGN
ncbi:MAG: PASTA domain-containing protein, partial [Bacteroidaceae bacterium]|nr:PASTA domain-containing protein [Bacteroidaceae bacterium]